MMEEIASDWAVVHPLVAELEPGIGVKQQERNTGVERKSATQSANSVSKESANGVGKESANGVSKESAHGVRKESANDVSKELANGISKESAMDNGISAVGYR
jgi:hypothetical protein